jgi:hypothetical protein
MYLWLQNQHVWAHVLRCGLNGGSRVQHTTQHYLLLHEQQSVQPLVERGHLSRVTVHSANVWDSTFPQAFDQPVLLLRHTTNCTTYTFGGCELYDLMTQTVPSVTHTGTAPASATP